MIVSSVAVWALSTFRTPLCTCPQAPSHHFMRRRIDDGETAALTANETFGALYLDMGGFKGINDMLGHHAGDEALREAANRIRTVIRSGDIAVRMGGDEFAAFVPNPPNAITLSSVAELLVSAFREPFKIEDIDVRACISGGGAVAPHAGTTRIDILRNADSAALSGQGRQPRPLRGAGRPELRAFFNARTRPKRLPFPHHHDRKQPSRATGRLLQASRYRA